MDKKDKKQWRRTHAPVCQGDGGGPAAGDVVDATLGVPHDDDGDGGDDVADGDARSRRRLARAVAVDDDEDDEIPSPGHPPVPRLSRRAPLTVCSYSRSLSTEISNWKFEPLTV